MSGARSRNRGAETERMVVRYLRANGWPDARRYMQGDGRQPGDIDFHTLVCLEVKGHVARSSWPSWCRQAAAEAREGMVPVVVRRTPGNPDVGAWECRVEMGGWIAATGTSAQRTWPDALGFGVDMGVDDDGLYIVHGWLCLTFAEFIAALHRFDTLDGAA